MDLETPIFGVDLDDTLYAEREWARSALISAATVLDLGRPNGPAFTTMRSLLQTDVWPSMPLQLVAEIVGIDDRSIVRGAIDALRQHEADVCAFADAVQVMQELRNLGSVVLITDGRSRTQRAKTRKLGIDSLVDLYVISQELPSGLGKADGTSYKYVRDLFGGRRRFFMIGDNAVKDGDVARRFGFEAYLVRRPGVRYVHQFPSGHTALSSLSEALASIRQTL